jgi:hypothetical protein
MGFGADVVESMTRERILYWHARAVEHMQSRAETMKASG